MVAAGAGMERALFDGLAADELVQLLLFDIKQLVIARRYRVHQLILHVKLRHRKHYNTHHQQVHGFMAGK